MDEEKDIFIESETLTPNVLPNKLLSLKLQSKSNSGDNQRIQKEEESLFQDFDKNDQMNEASSDTDSDQIYTPNRTCSDILDNKKVQDQ